MLTLTVFFKVDKLTPELTALGILNSRLFVHPGNDTIKLRPCVGLSCIGSSNTVIITLRRPCMLTSGRQRENLPLL
jgi:hypothetical protein